LSDPDPDDIFPIISDPDSVSNPGPDLVPDPRQNKTFSSSKKICLKIIQKSDIGTAVLSVTSSVLEIYYF